jgi:quinol monooxygenase YgiN
MIHVIATIHTTPGKRAEFLTQFHWVVPFVQAEDGCIEYGPAVDVQSPLTAVQPPLRPDVVIVVEKWASMDALIAHTKAPHMVEYRQRVTGLVTSVSLQILEPA